MRPGDDDGSVGGDLRRDPRTGRVLPTAPTPPPSTNRPPGRPTAPGEPDRVDAAGQRSAWVLAAAFVAAALVLGVGLTLLGMALGSDTLGWFGVLPAIPLARRGWELGLQARALTWGRGRYVFVVDRRTTTSNTQRWWAGTDAGPRATGHWLLLEDEGGAALGWFEVPRPAFADLPVGEPAAIFGAGADGLRRVVVTGPFPPVRTVGRHRTTAPVDLAPMPNTWQDWRDGWRR